VFNLHGEGWGVAGTPDQGHAQHGHAAMSDVDPVQPLLIVQYYVFTRSLESAADLIVECLNEISAAIRRGETAGQVTELPGAIPPLCEWHLSSELSLDDIRSALGMHQSRH
jgi:hypothetical protein